MYIPTAGFRHTQVHEHVYVQYVMLLLLLMMMMIIIITKFLVIFTIILVLIFESPVQCF
jgi:hypothetical protein